MRIAVPLVVIAALLGIAYFGVEALHLEFVFGVVIPYIAFAVFVIGFAIRVIKWALAPEPFNICTTAGQQKSLPWIKSQGIENPHNRLGVLVRVLLEVLLFRSLFRNLSAEKTEEGKLTYGSEKFLWLAGLAFHYSFLIVFLRHLRFFMEPIPKFLTGFEVLDGILQFGVPTFYLTDALIILAITYLFLRRVVLPQFRYISLQADYFPLLLIVTIAVTGILMRYFLRVDIVGIKHLSIGLVTLTPAVQSNVGVLFYMHLFMVSTLFFYFPFSKLMHMGGVFLSPTRIFRGNSRAWRHINPWNPDIKGRAYADYENDFRDIMKKVGLPVEKE